MACDTIKIETLDADEVVSIVTQGPQGPSGAEAATLTTTGDLLYRAALANARLPIGSEGQVLKVASGLPAWGNESGAVTSVNGETGAVVLDAADVGAAPASGISPSAISGTAVVDSDPRLSDARTPSSTLAHSSSHHTGGVDVIAPNDISAAWALETRQHSFFSTSAYTLAQGRNVQLNVSVLQIGVTGTITLPRLTTDLAQNGDDVFVVLGGTMDGGQTLVIERYIWTGSSYIGSTEALVTTTTTGAWRFRLLSGQWVPQPVASHTHAASAITSGTLDIARIPTGTSSSTVCIGDDARLSDARTPTSHTHELTALDATGATNGHVLTADGAGGVTFAAASGGVSAVNSTLADILSVSGSDLVADDLGSDKLYGWDDSESKAIGFIIGSGLSVSGDTLSATASGGSKTYAVFTATDNQPPASNYATLDTRNSIAVLDFDDATDESAVFVSIIPEGASLGSGLKIRLHWAATTATSGDVRWDVQLERMTTDLDSDSFDTVASATATTNGTSGILTVTEITLTTIDSVTAGDGFRLKVTRDANNAADTMSGDCELYICEVRSAA